MIKKFKKSQLSYKIVETPIRSRIIALLLLPLMLIALPFDVLYCLVKGQDATKGAQYVTDLVTLLLPWEDD